MDWAYYTRNKIIKITEILSTMRYPLKTVYNNNSRAEFAEWYCVTIWGGTFAATLKELKTAKTTILQEESVLYSAIVSRHQTV